MKRILCFGDSNTWGYDPVSKDRYEKDVRWTGILGCSLGSDYEVIEEGLNGRTTVWEDPIEGYKNGYSYLIPCLETHRPLDLVIIMLGTNDLKKRFNVSAFDIAQSAGVLVNVVMKSSAGREGAAPQVLLIAPPPVATLTGFAEIFEGAEPKSMKLGAYYHMVAEELGCSFLYAGEVIQSSEVDGIHFDPEEHKNLAAAVAAKVQELTNSYAYP
jgi:lysophospholipase L1-like esterase